MHSSPLYRSHREPAQPAHIQQCILSLFIINGFDSSFHYAFDSSLLEHSKSIVEPATRATNPSLLPKEPPPPTATLLHGAISLHPRPRGGKNASWKMCVFNFLRFENYCQSLDVLCVAGAAVPANPQWQPRANSCAFFSGLK